MEDKKKIKLLSVSSDNSGCFAHRVLWPHRMLQENYQEDFDIDIMHPQDLPKDNLSDFLKEYDILFFHKWLPEGVIEMAKWLNLLVIMDLDDDYQIKGTDHPLWLSSQRQNWAERIVKHMRLADAVITTTPIYAKELKRHNKNVFVLENGIDDRDPQFSDQKNPSKRVRFSIICGSAHQKDIELMDRIAALPQPVMNQLRLGAFGFDTRGRLTRYDKTTGQSRVENLGPEQSVWNVYERILTDNYKSISPEHKDFLLKYMQTPDPFMDSEPYGRFWTKDINHYGEHYRDTDVLLAPLKDNEFNSRKSALKVAECAYTGTALICSNYGPYTIDLKSYIEKGGKINPEGNCLLVDIHKESKQFAKYIQYLTEHKEVIPILVSNLRRDVLEKYSLKNITDRRAELYKRLLEEHKSS